MVIYLLESRFLFMLIDLQFFPTLLELRKFYFLLVLFLHEYMKRFRLFKLFKKRFEFLILLNPLFLFYLHNLKSLHDFFMVLKFFLLCYFMLNLLFDGLFLQLFLPLLLFYHLNSRFECFLFLVYLFYSLLCLFSDRMICRIVITPLLCNRFYFL